MAQFEDFLVGMLRVVGFTRKIGTPSVKIQMCNSHGDVILCQGATVPTNGDTGYAPGCIFMKTNGVLYYNNGSLSSASFVTPASAIGANSITSANIAAGSVVAAKLGTGAVTSAALASGAVVAAAIGTGAVTSAGLGSSSVVAAKLGANSVIASKVKYAAITLTVASGASSISGATSSGAVIIGVIPTSPPSAAAISSGVQVAKVYKSGATTAKASLNKAFTHASGIVLSVMTLKAA